MFTLKKVISTVLVLICISSIKAKKLPKEKVHVSSRQNENPALTVKIEDGNVRGREDRTVGSNKTYFAFQGIPYAQPPVGNLRFRPPVPNQKWNDLLNATQDKSECTQTQNPVTGSEDCLYLNVYTLSISQKKLSVMVWIYGGGFLSGNSSYSLYGPDYFLDQDVVFVSFNYRLGIFGFLSTGDLASPGNNGLRDQVLALKWVQKNIAQFGGDPNNVTIFGQSAGAVSVSYLLQSDQSKGLFQAAIQESGSSLLLWSLNRRAKEIAYDIGKELNITTPNSQVLVDGLRKINFAKLQNVATTVSNNKILEDPLNGLPFSPVIEPLHEGAFFSAKSHELLLSGKFNRVPTISGFNSNELAAAAGTGPLINLLLSLYFDKIFSNDSLVVPVDMNVNESQKTSVARYIKSHYFGPVPLPKIFQYPNLIAFLDDDIFVRAIIEEVRQKSKYAPVYFYKFSYEGRLGLLGGSTQRVLRGVGHAEELGYLFRRDLPASPSDALTRSRLVKLWTNFAKYRNPTPIEDDLLENVSWPTAGSLKNNLVYINIDSSLDIELNPNNKNVKFWNQLYDVFGHPPYDTY